MMGSGHGLPEVTVARIGGVLAQFREVERAILFGSRAKGVQRTGSDIDLALVGEGLDWRRLGQIEEALEELLLPYQFSLLDFGARTDAEVAAHIRRVGQVFYEQAGLAAESQGAVWRD